MEYHANVPSTEQRNYKNFKSCCVLRDQYDDERYKIVFHKIRSDLQDQDRLFWSQTGLVLRPRWSQTTSLKYTGTSFSALTCTVVLGCVTGTVSNCDPDHKSQLCIPHSRSYPSTKSERKPPHNCLRNRTMHSRTEKPTRIT